MDKQRCTSKDSGFLMIVRILFAVVTSLLLFWVTGYLMAPVDDLMWLQISSLEVSETVMDMLWMGYYLFSYIVPMAVCLVFIRITGREILKTFSWKYRNNGVKTLLWGMAVGFVLNGILIVLMVLTGDASFSFSEFLFFPLLAVLAGGIVQCSCEELLYRGYIYQYLKDRCGVAAAVLVGSVTFLLGHFGNLMYYGFAPAFLMNIFLLGVVFALMMRKTGSFWFACGVHTMWNFTQQYLFGLPNSGVTSLGAVFVGDVADNSFFFDSVFGIEGSWGCTVILGLLTVWLLIMEQKKPVSF